MYEQKPVEHYHLHGFTKEDYDHFWNEWEARIVGLIGWLAWDYLKSGDGTSFDDRGAIGAPLLEAAFKTQLHGGDFGPLMFQTQAEMNEWEVRRKERAELRGYSIG